MNAIEINGLTKKYKDVTAVDNLHLQIKQGELFALLGVNGAGKTTTIKMLCTLAKPTSGNAFLLGKSIVEEGAEVKKFIAVSPQETAVAPNLTVEENLRLMAGIHGLSPQCTQEKMQEMIQNFHLQEIIHKRAGKLSGGWQRRLSIAMALICQPQILFLDEPTLGLDVIARSDLWDLIRSLKGKMTIVMTTHYMEEAEALSDKIGIMKDGKLLCCGTAEEIKNQTGAEKFEEAFIRVIKRGQTV